MKQRIIIALAFLTGMALNLAAQTLDEAGTAFNAGIQFSKEEKFAEAAASYEQTISICEKLGDEGMDLQLKAEQQLPGTYYNQAKSLYDAKKYNDAIPVFEKSASYAEKMGEDKTADAARTYVAGIYTALGNSDYKNENYESAIEKYNRALASKPDYYKAYYGMGLVYKKQDNLSMMKESLDKVISMAGDDSKTIGNAKDAAGSAFRNTGAMAIQSKKYNDAVTNLLASQEYNDTDPSSFYYLALAYNSLGQWDDAIAAANKALELQTEDKSDIYFELGKSYEKKGDNATSCENYKKVTAGNNVAAAKYQIETVLKCQ